MSTARASTETKTVLYLHFSMNPVIHRRFREAIGHSVLDEILNILRRRRLRRKRRAGQGMVQLQRGQEGAELPLGPRGLHGRAPRQRRRPEGRLRAGRHLPRRLLQHGDGTGPADTANATALADFAPLGIKTDGAFRLERDGDRALLLTPIPDMGRPFRAELDLAALACPAATPLRDLQRSARPAATSLRGCDSASAVEPVDPAPGAARPDWRQTGATLSLAVDAKSFAYRVSF